MERSLLWKTLQIQARIMTSLLFDLKTYGIENVPQTGPALLAANHQSYLDPVLVAVHLRRPVSYFAKSELFENRYFGWLIRALGAFPVRLGEGDISAVRETIRRLGEGYLLNLYPEGTRTLDGQIQPIQRGFVLILRRVVVPVIPVVIDGSFEAWHKEWKIFHPHPIRVMYGKPLQYKDLKGDKIVELLESTLRSMLDELRQKRS
jgi:1-acyl-sn-glycerol-3-phosphate acyltransferase